MLLQVPEEEETPSFPVKTSNPPKYVAVGAVKTGSSSAPEEDVAPGVPPVAMPAAATPAAPAASAAALALDHGIVPDDEHKGVPLNTFLTGKFANT